MLDEGKDPGSACSAGDKIKEGNHRRGKNKKDVEKYPAIRAAVMWENGGNPTKEVTWLRDSCWGANEPI